MAEDCEKTRNDGMMERWIRNSCGLEVRVLHAEVLLSKEKVILAMEERNKPYFFSNKTKYSSLVIPAVLRLFLMIDTGTSS